MLVRLIAGGLAALAVTSAGDAQTVLRSSVLPNSRAATVGQTVTVFSTMLNSGETELTNCSVALAGTDPYTVGYQRTDAGNAPIGDANTPFSIPAGGSQSLVLSFTPTTAAAGDEVRLAYACDGATAPIVPGVNTVFLTASVTAQPDIVPILATPSGDGVLRFATQGQVRAMSAAAINIGEAADIDVSASAPFLPNLVGLQVCETDPTTGVCLAPRAASVRVNFAQNQTRTFAVFADANDNAGIPNLPAVSRIYLLFNGVPSATDGINGPAALFPPNPPVLGATSAAAIAPGPAGDGLVGVYRGLINGQPTFLVTHSFSQFMMGTQEELSDGFLAGVAFPTGNNYTSTTIGYADGETLPSAGIGTTTATYVNESYVRGTYRHVNGSPSYDFQAVWDPISRNVLIPNDIPEGTWTINRLGTQLGTLTVANTGNFTGNMTYPGADGQGDCTTDINGIAGGVGALGLNIASFITLSNSCVGGYYFFGYYDNAGGTMRMHGYASKQGSQSGTLDFFPVELVRQ